MMTLSKETAIQKITEMSAERVSKVLIFMAGMEAEHIIYEKSGVEKQRNSTNYPIQVYGNPKQAVIPEQLSLKDIVV